MKDSEPLPITPDFDEWPITHEARKVSAQGGALVVVWSDGLESRYHPYLLAENDPAPDALHHLSRETMLTPLDFPEDLKVQEAKVRENGAVEVQWSRQGKPSRFHPGWLRGIGWFGEKANDSAPAPILWRAKDQPEPPTFDGPLALSDSETFLDWLVALRDYGVARLEGLPDQDGLMMKLVEKIGPIRESHFGRTYTLEIKEDPDSLAYTAVGLPQHIDMPTRECPHGLQFLLCRNNTTSGGEGIYADGYRIAEDMKLEEPDHFRALCEIEWTYGNRSKTTSYKASGPVVERGADGEIAGIRYNTWLRGPLSASLEDQDRAYKAYRAFAARAQDPAYQMSFAYRPGDFVAFDNRRALHGRGSYDEKGGVRFIEGAYADRDDLHSAIRALERKIRKRKRHERRKESNSKSEN